MARPTSPGEQTERLPHQHDIMRTSAEYVRLDSIELSSLLHSLHIHNEVVLSPKHEGWRMVCRWTWKGHLLLQPSHLPNKPPSVEAGNRNAAVFQGVMSHEESIASH